MAGEELPIPEEELNEALRRALVVRAVGGDPHRELELEETAVSRLAEELDGAERRAALQAGLAALAPVLAARPTVAAALDDLRDDDELAWRCFAAARLAAALT